MEAIKSIFYGSGIAFHFAGAIAAGMYIGKVIGGQ